VLEPGLKVAGAGLDNSTWVVRAYGGLVDKGATATALEGVAARALALSTVSFIVDLLSKVDGTVLRARNLALNVVCSVKKALEVEAEQDECAARDCACTLLVAVVDQHRATFWQIGDGAICFGFPQK